MVDIRLSKFIDDPHQKFYYIYNFDRPYDLHVELIKILKEEDGKAYPFVFKSIGTVPKQLAAANFPLSTAEDEDEEEEDLPTDETEYGVDEDEDFDLFDGEDEGEGEEGTNGVEDEY